MAFVVPAAPAMVSVQLAPAAFAMTVKVVVLVGGVTENDAHPPPVAGGVSDAAYDPLNCSSIGVTVTLYVAPVPGKSTGFNAEPLFGPRLLDHVPVQLRVTALADGGGGVGEELGETLGTVLGEMLGEGASVGVIVGGAVGGGDGLPPPPPPPQADMKSALAASAGKNNLDRRIEPSGKAEKRLGFSPAPLSPGRVASSRLPEATLPGPRPARRRSVGSPS